MKDSTMMSQTYDITSSPLYMTNDSKHALESYKR